MRIGEREKRLYTTEETESTKMHSGQETQSTNRNEVEKGGHNPRRRLGGVVRRTARSALNPSPYTCSQHEQIVSDLREHLVFILISIYPPKNEKTKVTYILLEQPEPFIEGVVERNPARPADELDAAREVVVEALLRAWFDLAAQDLFVLLGGVGGGLLDDGLVLGLDEDGHERLEDGETALEDDGGKELAVSGLAL
jgi:hypothetical protein